VLLAATALTLTTAATAAQPVQAAHRTSSTSVRTLRNILNGPIQLNVRVTIQDENEDGATTTLIGETFAAGVEVGLGSTTVPLHDGTEDITITEQVHAGGVTAGEQVEVTVIGIDRDKFGLPISTATTTTTLTCGQPDSSGTITCS
jgi:hypothetical protein